MLDDWLSDVDDWLVRVDEEHAGRRAGQAAGRHERAGPCTVTKADRLAELASRRRRPRDPALTWCRPPPRPSPPPRRRGPPAGQPGGRSQPPSQRQGRSVPAGATRAMHGAPPCPAAWSRSGVHAAVAIQPAATPARPPAHLRGVAGLGDLEHAAVVACSEGRPDGGADSMQGRGPGALARGRVPPAARVAAGGQHPSAPAGTRPPVVRQLHGGHGAGGGAAPTHRRRHLGPSDPTAQRPHHSRRAPRWPSSR